MVCKLVFLRCVYFEVLPSRVSDFGSSKFDPVPASPVKAEAVVVLVRTQKCDFKGTKSVPGGVMVLVMDLEMESQICLSNMHGIQRESVLRLVNVLLDFSVSLLELCGLRVCGVGVGWSRKS